MPQDARDGRRVTDQRQQRHSLRPLRARQQRRPGASSGSPSVGVSSAHGSATSDIDQHGIAVVMKRALDLATTGTTGLHVSFDLDACDPAIAPGVGTPVKGGLSYREAHMVMEMIADSGKMTALDLVEVNPILDTQNQTATLAAELALSALGMGIL